MRVPELLSGLVPARVLVGAYVCTCVHVCVFCVCFCYKFVNMLWGQAPPLNQALINFILEAISFHRGRNPFCCMILLWIQETTTSYSSYPQQHKQ